MKNILYILLVLSLFSCSEPSVELSPEILEAYTTYYKSGDNLEWAKKDFDDSAWGKERDTTSKEIIFWARKYVSIKNEKQAFTPLALNVQAFGAYELYFDGILIGKNGKVGNEDKTGSVNRGFLIPDSLATKGKHTVAMRSSVIHLKNSNRPILTFVNDYYTSARGPLIDTAFMHILAGAFLVAFLYYLIMYLNNRKETPTLLFSIVSLLFFLLLFLEYLKFYYPIHYTYFYLRLEVIGALTLLIAFIVPNFFALEFSLKYHKIVPLLYGVYLLGIVFLKYGEYDNTARWLAQTMWVVSIIIVCFAVYKKEKGAITVLVGLLMSFAFYKVYIFDFSLFINFAILLLCMFYLLSVKLREQRFAFEESIAQSTRLKYELLKKKIQPHFLMNTLTSLIDWVEESPKKGVEFIESLAGEFDLLNEVEDKKLIPITQEIELCKSHLKIMKYRKEIDYEWQDKGVTKNSELLIPPAVIHTLLENGITHCLSLADNTMKFKLEVDSKDDELIYKFSTFGKVRNLEKMTKDGTGFKYIKARLIESYGNNWRFSSKPTEQGWQNIIKIEK